VNEVQQVKKEAMEEINQLEKELDLNEERIKSSLKKENEVVREYLLMIYNRTDNKEIKELTNKIAGKLKDLGIFPEKKEV